MAICRAMLAGVLREQKSLDSALDVINLSLDWFFAQQPPDERRIAKGRTTRAEINRDLSNYEAARDDITAALTWYETNLPGDTRTIGLMKQVRDSIAGN